jgi:hypothetical protein
VSKASVVEDFHSRPLFSLYLVDFGRWCLPPQLAVGDALFHRHRHCLGADPSPLAAGCVARQAGVKGEKVQRSHREALMTFFAHHDKEKVLKVDGIIEYYNTNDVCVSNGASYEEFKQQALE